MTHLTVLSVGSLKESYLSEAIAEYKKRLSAFCRVEEINLKEERIRDEDDPAAVAAALEAEGEALLARAPADAYRIALCVEGKTLSSEELAARIGEAADRCGKLALFIGSSHGLSPAVKQKAELCLSLGRLTFPHQLVRVLLMEVLYRSFCIRAGKRYHK